MIISASRRTDIPAFFSDWFFTRLSEGYVITKNPFNANQLTKLKLASDVVDAIVFWTKNAAPMLTRIRELDAKGFTYYFQFTMTPYAADVEPGLPGKAILIDTFKTLAAEIGSKRVIWRYDPIFISETYSVDWHIRSFRQYAKALQGSTEKVVISFLDRGYNNTKKIDRLGIRDGTPEEKGHLADAMLSIARENKMEIATCAEEVDLGKHGIERGRCIDDRLIEQLTGYSPKGKKDKNQRNLCGCFTSVDIGIYNTCSHSCVYCYANFNPTTIHGNCKQHNPKSPLLIGECDADSLDFKKDQRSLLQRQPGLF